MRTQHEVQTSSRAGHLVYLVCDHDKRLPQRYWPHSRHVLTSSSALRMLQFQICDLASVFYCLFGGGRIYLVAFIFCSLYIKSLLLIAPAAVGVGQKALSHVFGQAHRGQAAT